MDWYEVALNVGQSVAFPDFTVPGNREKQVDPDDYLGGIIHGGDWGWVTCRYASDASLLVIGLDNGECVARHTFWRETISQDNKAEIAERCSISFVEEIFSDQPDRPPLLVICLESWDSGQRRPDRNTVAITSQLRLYSINDGQVLCHLHMTGLLCSSLAYLERRICTGTQLEVFDGCLAVATMEGIVLLVDLNATNLLASKTGSGIYPCPHPNDSELHRVPVREHGLHSEVLLEELRLNGQHLALELDAARVSIRSLVGIAFAPCFAAGLDDSRIVIYNLFNFQLITTLRTPISASFQFGAVERLCVIVPPDDPKPCFYICAMYRDPDNLSMLLHSVNYTRARGDDFRFEHIYASSVRNHQTLDIGYCSGLGCSTVSTFSFAGDNGTLLAILSWHSHSDRKNKLVLFDMNQWYKDEMPEAQRQYEKPNYLAGYTLQDGHLGAGTGLALYLRPSSIMHFVALQRYEEHLYPNSLTFDCSLLTGKGWRYYSHDGLQRSFLNALSRERAPLFLRPQICHEHIVRLRLLPQFCELNVDATFSKSAMYEVILSVALEHRCTALLNDCARSWLDGSFQCNMLNSTQLSLGTLTNWIVRRAGHIKQRISDICQGIFDYGGYTLDERERREFEVLSRQMAELVRLQTHILTLGQRCLTSGTQDKLEEYERALQSVHEYQRVLYWLIRQGLLPEGQHVAQEQQQEQPLVALRRSFAERRTQRRRLYIDTLTKDTSLAKDAYPPDTLQAFLHVMLDPSIKLSRKHELLLYMLMDLDQNLAKNFPLAFNMEEAKARSVCCFWWLDRGDYEQCLAELYDNRRSAPKDFEDSQTPFLVETLMKAGKHVEAMRVVRQPPGSLTAALEMDVRLANNFVSEAIRIARLALDDNAEPLFERFVRRCIEYRRYKVFAEFTLSEHEEQMVYRLLDACRTRETESVKLILLLLKSKYIEAVNFMDEVAARRELMDDTTNSILAAFRATMAPVTQNIAGTYFRIRNKLDEGLENDGPDAEHRQPLSCQLVRQNASDRLGGIFQSSAISALWAEQCDVTNQGPPTAPRRPQLGNIPFLRNEQYGAAEQPESVRTVRPVPHQVVGKRHREQDWEREQEVSSVASSWGTVQPRKRRRLQAEQLMDDIRGQVDRLRQSEMEAAPELGQCPIKASDLVTPPSCLQQTRQKPPTRPNVGSPIPTILKRRPAPAVVFTPPTDTSTSLSSLSKRFRFQSPVPLSFDAMQSENAAEEEELKDTEENKMEQLEQLEQEEHEEQEEQEEHEEQLDQENQEEHVEQEEEDDDETDEIIMEIESPSEPHGAYSVDEDVFLSPLPSSRVSLGAEASTQIPPAGPQPRGSLIQGRTETGIPTGSGSSSGFGSFATVQPAETTSSSFVPTVCSSKMYETQSQLFSTASIGMAKISERTTICGDMESTDLVPTMTPTASVWQLSMPAPASERQSGQQALRMLDTTLDMTNYEATSLFEQPTGEDQQDITELVVVESEEDEGEQQQQQVERSPSRRSSSGEPSPDKRSPSPRNLRSRNPTPGKSSSSRSSSSSSGESGELFSPEKRRAGRKDKRVSPNVGEPEGEEEVQLVSEWQEEEEQQQQEEEAAASEAESAAAASPKPSSSSERSSDHEESEDESMRTQATAESDMMRNREATQLHHQQQQQQQQNNERQQRLVVVPEERSERGYYRGTGPNRAPLHHGLPTSPTISLSSGASDISTPELHRPGRDHEANSSNDEESTGSITTSRSFLPSDTNVSQNSSPRTRGAGGGDGNLYRANSLETVDDLDTTKGSLEEEEEEEDEDDCVIALDGTEVRGYIARPQPATTSSSAELFAFKDERADEAAPDPGPSLSLGATVNSDSVVDDIIELDSDSNEEAKQQPQQQPQQPETIHIEIDLDVVMVPESVVEPAQEPEVQDDQSQAIDLDVVMVPESVVEPAQEPEVQDDQSQAQPESDTSIVQEEDSRQSLTLVFSDETGDDEEVAAATTAMTSRRLLRPRRKPQGHHHDSPITRTMRLRSDDSDGRTSSVASPSGRTSSVSSPTGRTSSVASPSGPTTSKRRLLKHRALLQVIEEQEAMEASLPRTRSRSRLSSADTTDGESPHKMTLRGQRATSLAPTESPVRRRSLRGISEPPMAAPRRSLRGLSVQSSTPTRTTPTIESKAVRTLRTQSRKSSANSEVSPAVSPVSSEPELPRLRRTTRRQNSELSEASSTTSNSQTRELRPRRNLQTEQPVSSRTPTPTEGTSNEAHMPPKKRGRSKRQ